MNDIEKLSKIINKHLKKPHSAIVESNPSANKEFIKQLKELRTKTSKPSSNK